MPKVFEYLYQIQDKRKREIAEQLGLDIQFDVLLDSVINAKLYQALRTNALIHKAIDCIYEWHSELVFKKSWLETPDAILKLRKYRITENNIVTLLRNFVEESNNLDEADLERFGFSRNQIKKYYRMVGKGEQVNGYLTVARQSLQEESTSQARNLYLKRSTKILLDLDIIDQAIERLKKNGYVIKVS